MPKNRSKTIPRRSKRRGPVAGTSRSRPDPTARRKSKSNSRARSTSRTNDLACVIEDGRTTHVLVPVDEYEELIKVSMVARAIEQIESGDNDFVDADDFALELAAERIVAARKAKGLTQKQLGGKLGLPQSQISRIERNPDRTTVRTLKRIARALGVDVSALV